MTTRAKWSQATARKLLTELGEVVLSHPNMMNLYSYPQEAVQPVADHIVKIDAALRGRGTYQREYFFGPGGIQAIANPGADRRSDGMKTMTPEHLWETLQDELEEVARWMVNNEGRYKGCPSVHLPTVAKPTPTP